jgi:DNA-binding NarL/FixJ family response regulator
MDQESGVTVLLEVFEDLVARGLRAYVDEDPNLDVVADGIPHVRLDAELAERAPRVAILNFGSLTTPTELHMLARAHPETRLIVLASRPSPQDCNQLLAFGATACLSKDVQARDVIGAIHLASRGLHVLPRSAAELAPAPQGPDLLTSREADVLDLLRDGRSNGQIALELRVGIETVRTHARNVYRKLGVTSRRELQQLGDARR